MSKPKYEYTNDSTHPYPYAGVIKLSDYKGYTVNLWHDEDALNPFTKEFGDCEPPIAVLNLDLYHSKLENYDGIGLNLTTLIEHLPNTMWLSDEGQREITEAIGFDPENVALCVEEQELDYHDAITELIYGLKPDGWSEWKEYFNVMERVAELANIPCALTTSNGYSQGDSALVFSAALPEWVKRVGASNLEEQCQSACRIWGDWAWGRVYGIELITDPDGCEVQDGAVWGFYGDDHHESGLVDAAVDSIRYDIKSKAREAEKAFEAACRDIATV